MAQHSQRCGAVGGMLALRMCLRVRNPDEMVAQLDWTDWSGQRNGSGSWEVNCKEHPTPMGPENDGDRGKFYDLIKAIAAGWFAFSLSVSRMGCEKNKKTHAHGWE